MANELHYESPENYKSGIGRDGIGTPKTMTPQEDGGMPCPLVFDPEFL